jgi:hypothetical protein
MADVVPPEAQQLARFAGGDVARSRLLLAAGGVRVYAFPADRGRLCIVRVRLGGSCISALIHGVYPQVEPRRDVWGIVDDGAASVDVTVGRRTLRAHLGRNAFFLRLPARAVVPTRIVVRERDGARHVFTVRRCTPRDVSPLSSPLGPPC